MLFKWGGENKKGEEDEEGLKGHETKSVLRASPLSALSHMFLEVGFWKGILRKREDRKVWEVEFETVIVEELNSI